MVNEAPTLLDVTVNIPTDASAPSADLTYNIPAVEKVFNHALTLTPFLSSLFIKIVLTLPNVPLLNLICPCDIPVEEVELLNV